MSHIPHCGCFIPIPLFHFPTPFLFLKNNPRFLTLGAQRNPSKHRGSHFFPVSFCKSNFCSRRKGGIFYYFRDSPPPPPSLPAAESASRHRCIALLGNITSAALFFVWGKPAVATAVRLQFSREWPVSHLSRTAGSAEGRPAHPHPLACSGHPPCLPTISATCSELGTGTHSVMFTLFFRGSLS